MASDRFADFYESNRYLDSLLVPPHPRPRQRLHENPDPATALRPCQRLLEYLGNPHHRLKFIHVAGTSGKGSVCAFLHSVLYRAGICVGSYLSPHVTAMIERIAINDKLLSPGHWSAAIERVKPHVESMLKFAPEDVPSYHDILLSVALREFVDVQCELVVLEVGLGGTFDPTNIIPAPLVAIITRIGRDHTEILGENLEDIARDKAGIIKQNCSVFSGISEPEIHDIIRSRASSKGATVVALDGEIQLRARGRTLNVSCPTGELTGIVPGMLGAHQGRNAALAVGVLLRLRELGWSLPDSTITEGLANAFLPGRFEVIPTSSDGAHCLVLDIAHNDDKSKAFADTWLSVFGIGEIVVLAVAESKDSSAIIGNLAKAFHSVFLAPVSSPARGMKAPEELAAQALSHGMNVVRFEEPIMAVKEAFRKGASRVAVTGSTAIVRQVRRSLQSESEILSSCRIRRLDAFRWEELDATDRDA